MICPSCKKEMYVYQIPYVELNAGVYHICENKKCVWFGIQRIEVKVK